MNPVRQRRQAQEMAKRAVQMARRSLQRGTVETQAALKSAAEFKRARKAAKLQVIAEHGGITAG